MQRPDVRNIAIIAHVDHGKTTLVDCLLRQSGSVAAHTAMQERAMDKLDLERERGITILSKNTAVSWRGITINIVDTPGHSDFGGEVERVLGMVDSVLLVVDAFEGPMPQTRFVLRKALSHGLRPMVVINKCDRADGRPEYVLDAIFDLFVSLDATDEQLDFKVVYASARQGWAVHDLAEPRDGVAPLLDSIVRHVPGPEVDDGPLQMQVATINYDEFVGRIAIGRIRRGEVRKGQVISAIDLQGNPRQARVSRLTGFEGLKQVEIESARAGDIVGIAGFPKVLPNETLCANEALDPLPAVAIDEPTITMSFIANSGPRAGMDGKYVTSRKLRERLDRELQSNVALRVEDTDSPEVFQVSGRGELHLGILIETMRREGYEVMVSMPQVILRDGPSGQEEPYEEVTIDCGEPFSGSVIADLNLRGGEMTDLRQTGDQVRIEYRIPSRGLIGYRSRFLTQTRGTGTLYKSFCGYGPYKGPFQRRQNGVLIAQESGTATAYSLETLQDRGILFIEPGDEVYGGQVVGENSRARDMVVNPCKAKKLDNMRQAFKEIDTRMQVPRKMGLEEALEYINDDELVEVTPAAIRLRKRLLDHNDRKRDEKIRGII
ncbi:MAG: translational GTPase TypA [bacterium]|nr:translational GTPase TypA [Myxococcales bacterium]MCB9541048.1 translational GTPase TypA [Myxococcales bacterium]MCB9553862.1 translational GTPase TypA [Myxococcales bacterium]